jgi:hypothetical protein
MDLFQIHWCDQCGYQREKVKGGYLISDTGYLIIQGVGGDETLVRGGLFASLTGAVLGEEAV